MGEEKGGDMRDGVDLRKWLAGFPRRGVDMGPVVGGDHEITEGWDLVTDLELASLGE